MTERLFLSPPHMGTRERTLVGEAFDTNWIAPTGPMVDRFETDLSSLTGIGHVAALSSGTAALHLALRLLGVSAGAEVWGSTLTFVGGVAAIDYVGARPVFIDVAERDLLINLDLLEEALTAAERNSALPAAIITTDLYGLVVDMERMRALADRFRVFWIADSAEAVGAYFNDRHAGHGADFTILSFNGNKIITTSGGGALASASADLIVRARFLATQARDPAPHYEHTTLGYNYRLSNVCAAIGVGQLEILASHVNARRRIHNLYRERLAVEPGIGFTEEAPGSRATRWLTTVSLNTSAGFDPETARLAMEKVNIESRPLWKPMHLQPVFANARMIGGAIAERAFACGLCLPSGSAMTDGDVDRVCDVLLSSRA